MLQQNKLDQAGIVASLACGVHCALSAALVGLTSLSGAGQVLLSEPLEMVFFASACIIGIAAGIHGWRKHRTRPIFGWLIAGLTLLALSYFAHSFSGAGGVLSPLLSIAGAIFLITFHQKNRRPC